MHLKLFNFFRRRNYHDHATQKNDWRHAAAPFHREHTEKLLNSSIWTGQVLPYVSRQDKPGQSQRLYPLSNK